MSERTTVIGMHDPGPAVGWGRPVRRRVGQVVPGLAGRAHGSLS